MQRQIPAPVRARESILAQQLLLSPDVGSPRIPFCATPRHRQSPMQRRHHRVSSPRNGPNADWNMCPVAPRPAAPPFQLPPSRTPSPSRARRIARLRRRTLPSNSCMPEDAHSRECRALALVFVAAESVTSARVRAVTPSRGTSVTALPDCPRLAQQGDHSTFSPAQCPQQNCRGRPACPVPSRKGCPRHSSRSRPSLRHGGVDRPWPLSDPGT